MQVDLVLVGSSTSLLDGQSDVQVMQHLHLDLTSAQAGAVLWQVQQLVIALDEDIKGVELEAPLVQEPGDQVPDGLPAGGGHHGGGAVREYEPGQAARLLVAFLTRLVQGAQVVSLHLWQLSVDPEAQATLIEV